MVTMSTRTMRHHPEQVWRWRKEASLILSLCLSKIIVEELGCCQDMHKRRNQAKLCPARTPIGITSYDYERTFNVGDQGWIVNIAEDWICNGYIIMYRCMCLSQCFRIIRRNRIIMNRPKEAHPILLSVPMSLSFHGYVVAFAMIRDPSILSSYPNNVPSANLFLPTLEFS
jgi:hypothetical protein